MVLCQTEMDAQGQWMHSAYGRIKCGIGCNPPVLKSYLCTILITNAIKNMYSRLQLQLQGYVTV